MFQKMHFNHFLVHFSAKTNLRRAKNVVFSIFCILIDRPIGGYSPPPTLLKVTLTHDTTFQIFSIALRLVTDDIAFNNKKTIYYD